MKNISRKKARQPAAGQLPPEPHPAPATGLPAMLQAGIEQLAGYSLDGVRVHYNAARPAQLQARADAQDTTNLPHEAWHVVQQHQGPVPAERPAPTSAPPDDAGAV